MKYPLVITLSLGLVAVLLALDTKIKMAKLTASYQEDMHVASRVYRDLTDHIAWLIRESGLKISGDQRRARQS